MHLIFTVLRYVSAVYAVVVCLSVQLSLCLSVCSSQVSTLPKWLNAGLRKQRQKIAQGLYVLMPKISVKFQRDHPQWGAKYRWGRFIWQFLTNILLYLRNGAR